MDEELDPVIVAVRCIVADRIPLLVIVVDVVEVLLDDALPVIVGDDDDERELRPDCVSVGDTREDLERPADIDRLGEFVIDAVNVLTAVAVTTAVTVLKADGDSRVFPEAVYDKLVVGVNVRRDDTVDVLLLVEEPVSVDEIREETDIVSVCLLPDGEALMENDCDAVPVFVRLIRAVQVLLPEVVAVLDDVIDEVCVFVSTDERVVDGEPEVVFVDVIERD